MPKIDGVLETSLYVGDMDRAVRFYTSVLSLEIVESSERLSALRLADRQLLLLCKRGASASLPVGAHDGEGRFHLALAIPAEEWRRWEEQLDRHGVTIEERRRWQFGGQSLYFRDPDGHLIELATPGVWTIY
jgi:catechol 2,3-dioxygenase-like lactoylglutathione lyase family enzyme